MFVEAIYIQFLWSLHSFVLLTKGQLNVTDNKVAPVELLLALEAIIRLHVTVNLVIASEISHQNIFFSLALRSCGFIWAS